MRTVVGVVLGACALGIVTAAALGTAPFLVTPTPWVVGLIGVAMLAVVAQPAAAPSARRVAKVLTVVGSVGAVVAWAAYLRGFSDENGVRGWPDALDSMVDLGSSTAALASGVNVKRMTLITMALSGAVAGLAGAVLGGAVVEVPLLLPPHLHSSRPAHLPARPDGERSLIVVFVCSYGPDPWNYGPCPW